MLFPRDFKGTVDGGIRTSGDHVKVRDYFEHALAHPELDPYVYFTPRSDYKASDVWDGVPPARIVRELDVAPYDLVFVTGKEWRLLPRDLGEGRVVQLVPSIQQCDPEHKLFRYFKRPAHRICVSDEVAAAVAPHVRGELTVIPNGIPLDLFQPAGVRDERSVLIWGRKNAALAATLRDALLECGLAVDLLIDNVPRGEFARRLARSAVAVTLPRETEGFFLPALEAMACGAAVVCPDALGNRSFCIDGETCLMPPRDSLVAHVAAVERLIADEQLAGALRTRGLQMAQSFPLERERQAFHRFIDERVLATA